MAYPALSKSFGFLSYSSSWGWRVSIVRQYKDGALLRLARAIGSAPA